MKVTNSFLVSLTSHSKFTSTINMTQKAQLGGSQRDEPTIIILLNGHSSRLPSKFESLHPHISAVQTSSEKFLCAMDGGEYRNSQMIKEYSISIIVQSIVQHRVNRVQYKYQWRAYPPVNYHISQPSPRLRVHDTREGRQIIRAICLETMSPGHRKTVNL